MADDAHRPRDRECLGSFASLDAFVRETIGPLLPVGLRWLLDCLDHERVVQALTAGGSDRLRVEGGRVYLERAVDEG